MTLHHGHSFDLYLPSNMYSLCVLDDLQDEYNTAPPSQRHNFVFLATTNNVYCIQPQIDNATAISIQEIPIHTIARIPADTDIVSMSAFRYNDNKIILATALTQFLGEDRAPRNFLYLYIFTEEELIMKRILGQPQDNFLQSFQLRYTPLQLLRKRVEWQGVVENVFLLSGLDRAVHCFATKEHDPNERYPTSALAFMEIETYDYMRELFPSLLQLPSSALCIDIHETTTHQITAVGCQNGFLRITVLSKSRQGEVLESAPLFLNGPVSSLKLFRICENRKLCHPFVGTILKQMRHKTKVKSPHPYDDDADYDPYTCLNLLVGEAMGRVTLYRNVEFSLLEDPDILLSEDYELNRNIDLNVGTPILSTPQISSRRSSVTSITSLTSVTSPRGSSVQYKQDSILCVNYFDIDADGLNEILIGTYSKKMLVFKAKENGHYELSATYKFPSPVYSIEPVDINCDGVVELLVSSMYNLHIMQPDLEEMQNKVMKRLTLMMEKLAK